jgi:flagellar basal-body rod modification protein FlgD
MDAISSLGSGSATGPSTPNAFSSLSSEQFVRIMFTELAHQDPLQPNDSKALLEQLSSLRNIQSGLDLSNRMNALVSQNEMSAAAGLIGKRVSGVSEANGRVTGVVDSVIRTQDAGAVLKLKTGDLIRMTNLDQVLSGVSGPSKPRSAA